ncbi:hypothetical protein HMPREF1487_09667 [Pseudomonas sp. HPB0071]|uniref:hypothetical protein n=1 Tax=Pseudomonas TaxID=286 RepID=UPI0002C9B3F3|nr:MULTISPECIES: hypothetical protein [Pseudomonas]ENA26414.1 hypothetical protein HMPREF1487_09667 [Pseudomonas sp. HPB0071]QEU31482.1 hypothetical protein FOB45_27355 [Pseudomonas luteola]
MDKVNGVVSWVPVIATLVGAGLGFLASFLTTYYNQNAARQTAKNQRDRERIEALYRLIEVAKIELSRDQKNALYASDGLYNEISYSPVKEGELSPFVEIEMLIDLYFPSLKEKHQQFDNSRSEFRVLCLRLMDEPMQSKIRTTQELELRELHYHFEKVCDDLYCLKAILPELIES